MSTAGDNLSGCAFRQLEEGYYSAYAVGLNVSLLLDFSPTVNHLVFTDVRFNDFVVESVKMTHSGTELASCVGNPFPVLFLGFVAWIEHNQSVVERLEEQSEVS